MLVREELPKMYKITTILQEYDLLYRDLEEENRQLQERIDKAIEDLGTLFGTDDEDINCIIRELKGEE